VCCFVGVVVYEGDYCEGVDGGEVVGCEVE